MGHQAELAVHRLGEENKRLRAKLAEVEGKLETANLMMVTRRERYTAGQQRLRKVEAELEKMRKVAAHHDPNFGPCIGPACENLRRITALQTETDGEEE